MALLFALLLIVGGALGAAALIIAKQPNARDVIGKLVPFQGIIGIALLILSIIVLLQYLQIMSFVMSVAPLTGILFLLTLLVGIALGFLLGFGLINHYVLSKNANASRGGSNLQATLAKFQAPLGIASILLGIWYLVQALGSPMGAM